MDLDNPETKLAIKLESAQVQRDYEMAVKDIVMGHQNVQKIPGLTT